MRNPPIFLIILLGTVVSTIFAFVLFEMPVIDADFLHGNKIFLSALCFAGGIGGLTSGIYLLRRKSSRGILWFMVFCTVMSGVAVVTLGHSRDVLLLTLCTAGIDFAFIGTRGVSNTVLQLLTDEERRGRVLGINTMGAWGIMAVMIIVLGVIASARGITFALTLAGLLCFAAAGIYLLSISLATSPAADALHGTGDRSGRSSDLNGSANTRENQFSLNAAIAGSYFMEGVATGYSVFGNTGNLRPWKEPLPRDFINSLQ